MLNFQLKLAERKIESLQCRDKNQPKRGEKQETKKSNRFFTLGTLNVARKLPGKLEEEMKKWES